MSRTDLQGCICAHCVVDDDVRATHGRWIEMMSLFNERQARLYAAEKAMALGHGGAVSNLKCNRSPRRLGSETGIGKNIAGTFQ